MPTPRKATSRAPAQPPRPRHEDNARERLAQAAADHPEKALFLEYLEQRNLKLTRQREAVIDEIFEGRGHFEAEEIVQRLRQRKLRVSRATVYRTLELLKECQLVERLDFGTAHAYYEHTHVGEHHDHLICDQCGSITEFHNERLEAIQAEICKKHGFEESHHSLRIFGRCKKCRGGRA